MSDSRRHADDLREVVRLLVAATTGVTDVVEAMHQHIGSGPAVLGRPLALPTRVVTRLAYGSVRGVTRIVGGALDVALERLAPFLGESAPGPERAALSAVLNGVLGDWLAATNSPLAIPMRIHRSGDGKRVHYNSGLRVLDNGQLLARELEVLADADEIVILAHSMGGLVARAACHVAEADGAKWRKKLTTLIFLGTPHRGSPVERAGHLLDLVLPLTGYSAPLAKLGLIRSAGVMDLRHGLDLPLPEGVPCYAIAAGKDVLVPIESAHGPVPADHCSVVPGIDHLELLGNAEVYDAIVRALQGADGRSAAERG